MCEQSHTRGRKTSASIMCPASCRWSAPSRSCRPEVRPATLRLESPSRRQLSPPCCSVRCGRRTAVLGVALATPPFVPTLSQSQTDGGAASLSKRRSLHGCFGKTGARHNDEGLTRCRASPTLAHHLGRSSPSPAPRCYDTSALRASSSA